MLACWVGLRSESITGNGQQEMAGIRHRHGRSNLGQTALNNNIIYERSEHHAFHHLDRDSDADAFGCLSSLGLQPKLGDGTKRRGGNPDHYPAHSCRDRSHLATTSDTTETF